MIHRTVVKTSNIEITANVDTTLADAPSRCYEKLEKRWQPKTIADDKTRASLKLTNQKRRTLRPLRLLLSLPKKIALVVSLH